MRKLAIITSHPIQYNAPLFRLLNTKKLVDIKVFYTWGQTKEGNVYDPDFKTSFTWDIPLLDGYESEFIENISGNPGAGHFRGIKNRDLIERITFFQPDILLIYGWSFHSHLKAIRFFRKKIKIIFRGDSTLLDEVPGFSFKKIIRRFFLRWVYHQVDIALYAGKANKEYFLKHGLKEAQLKYAPHCIDNQRFFDTDGVKRQKALLKKSEMGVPVDAIVFLFAGKLEKKKNPLLLIQAFLSLNSNDSYLLVAGSGALEEEIRLVTKSNSRIKLLGFQNQQQMQDIYHMSDVFVLPSTGPGETWGLSVNEAMASNCAIIVTDKCGCAQDLINENGFVIPANDFDALKKALIFFVNNPERLNDMRQKSGMIIQQFSLEKTADTILTSL